MKKTLCSFLFLLSVSTCFALGDLPGIDIKQSKGVGQEQPSKINLKFATKEEARKLLMTEDHYIEGLNHFDIVSRLENLHGTKEELIELAGKEALEWKDSEREMLERVARFIEECIDRQGFEIQFPEEIIMVKTTMREEGDAAAYTRQNWIAMGEKLFHYHEGVIEHLMTHELFHILTRDNPEFKKQMYETIGFHVTNEEIELPEDIRKMRISNPDIGRYDSYAEFTVNGVKKNCMMCIYTDRDYTEGKFFAYLNVGFIPLDEQLRPIQEEGKTVIYALNDVTDFFDKIGKNTQYVIHPEEILADNFAFTILDKADLPTLVLKEKIQKLLKEER